MSSPLSTVVRTLGQAMPTGAIGQQKVTVHAGEQDLATQSREYVRYFESGTYARRYPRPNRLTLARVLRLIPADRSSTLIDYGCGDGRYLIPLLRARPKLAAVAVDPCPAALVTLGERLRDDGLAPRVRTVCGDIDTVAGLRDLHQPDLALLLFGVLGHIQPAAERLRVLHGLRRVLAPASGRIALSVPNADRRFLDRPAGASDVVYRRDLQADGEIALGYHLFSWRSVTRTLRAAGFAEVEVVAESLTSEHLVTAHQAVGLVDAWLAHLLPARLGYGLFATARVPDAG